MVLPCFSVNAVLSDEILSGLPCSRPPRDCFIMQIAMLPRSWPYCVKWRLTCGSSKEAM